MRLSTIHNVSGADALCEGPNAAFHLQRKEVEYMLYGGEAHPFYRISHFDQEESF